MISFQAARDTGSLLILYTPCALDSVNADYVGNWLCKSARNIIADITDDEISSASVKLESQQHTQMCATRSYKFLINFNFAYDIITYEI